MFGAFPVARSLHDCKIRPYSAMAIQLAALYFLPEDQRSHERRSCDSMTYAGGGRPGHMISDVMRQGHKDYVVYWVKVCMCQANTCDCFPLHVMHRKRA